MKHALVLTVALSLALPAFVVAPALAADENRYELLETKQGFVRLDKQSGAVSQCKMEGDNLTCRLAADERAAYEKEISRLIAENETLRAQVGSGEVKPNGLPTEEEIDETISMFEKFAAALFKAMKRVQKDMEDIEEGDIGETAPTE